MAFQENIITNCTKHGNTEVNPIHTYRISVSEILKGYVKDDFPTFFDAQNFLKRLLKKSIKDTMFRNGLSRCKMSGKQDCFFYKLDKNRAVKVKAEYPGGSTRRTLFGKYFDYSWHFGISFKVLLEPLPSYSMKSHLIFTYDGYKILTEDKKMFTARRRKGKRMFNREWRDLLMAMLSSLKDDDGKIYTVLNDQELLEMKPYTVSFESDLDYFEPKKGNRLDILIDDFEEEEEEEFIEAEVLADDDVDDE